MKNCLWCQRRCKWRGTLFCSRKCWGLYRRQEMPGQQKNISKRLGQLLGRCVPQGKCLIWTGCLHHTRGYGSTSVFGKFMAAHRAVWLLSGRKIPEGLVLCHKCDNRACVNIDHLFLGTQKDNMTDCAKKGRLAVQKRMYCPRGHPYAGFNLVMKKGGKLRLCRICTNDRARKYRAKRKLREPDWNYGKRGK